MIGRLYAEVAWIDTEGTFRGERIIEIADRFNLDSEAVLDNIIVARTFTHEMMNNALIALAAKMAEEPFKLLVIDSIMAHFRVDFVVRIRDSARRPRGGGAVVGGSRGSMFVSLFVGGKGGVGRSHPFFTH